MTTLYKQVGSNIVEMTAEEVARNVTAQTEGNTLSNRSVRNQLLSDSDWTQIPDSALTDEAKALWVTYRTALRDLTAHANWPNLEADDWPTKP
jgi:protein required for attachment to host cells